MGRSSEKFEILLFETQLKVIGYISRDVLNGLSRTHWSWVPVCAQSDSTSKLELEVKEYRNVIITFCISPQSDSWTTSLNWHGITCVSK